MLNKKNYIGQNDSGEYVFQELNSDGTIRGFNICYTTELVDGTMVFDQSSWRHAETIGTKENGDELTYKTGMLAAPCLELPEHVQDLYECNTVTCEVCSAVHDSDDCTGYSSNPTWTIINECEAVCMGCRTSDDVMVELKDASDLFKAKNLYGVDLKGYTEVEILFCDSSGFGSVGERALTPDQATDAVQALLDKAKTARYAGITGISQFQVYITVYRKNAKRARKAA
jgi:hypothetical protein